MRQKQRPLKMENEELRIILDRIQDNDSNIQQNALNMLFTFTKTTHSKNIGALDFEHLADQLPMLEKISESLEEDRKRFLCDIISAISVIGDKRKMLDFRVKGNIIELENWGHLYVKTLIGAIVDVKNNELDYPFHQTKDVSKSCIQFLFKHNAEFEAIDFLLEIEEIDSIINYVETHNYNRIILYLEDMASFYDLKDIILSINLKMNNHSRYVVGLIKNGRKTEAIEYVKNIKENCYKLQCLYILAKCNIHYESNDVNEKHILSNAHIKHIYRNVAKELEIENPSKIDLLMKGYKHDKEIKQFSPIAIANSFIHMGHGRDPIFLPKEGDERHPLNLVDIMSYDSQEMISIIASVGIIESWNSERVMEILQEHIFGENSFRKTGSLLGLAMASLKNYDENPAILALLSTNLQSNNTANVVATLLGIQAMYSGTHMNEIRELLQPLIFSENNEIAFFTAFTLGSVFCGSADENLTSLLLQTFLEKSKESESPFFRFILLGLACLFYKRSDVECGIMDLGDPLSKHGGVLIKGFQYAGSGDPTIIETILTESFTGETDAFLESLGLLSCTLVGMGDEVTGPNIGKIVSSSLLLDSPHLRSLLPLCYALLYPSNPQTQILDTLEKSLNIGETNCVMSTLLSLGIIGAGTLNSRIIKILDQQYSYYYKDSKVLFILKIAQGLVSMGKGLLTLSPLHYDKSLAIEKNLIGLFSTLFMFLDSSSSPLTNSHGYLFYLLTQAATPKYVHCDEKITVKVGLPVNIVGVVGEPRKLSSIQIHTTPVVFNDKERAEADENVCTSFIEDVLVVKN